MEQEPLTEKRVGLKHSNYIESFLEQSSFFRRVAYGALAVWSAGVGVAVVENVNSQHLYSYDEEYASYIDGINELVGGAPIALEDGSTIDPQFATGAELAPSTTIELTPVQKLGIEIDPRVEVAMAGMDNMSIDGYNRFLQSIDSSPLEYSSQFREFNQDAISALIPQLQSEFLNLHFTVVYANDTPGFGETMIGDFNVNNMIRSMAGRGGFETKCCGANWMIGRAANTFQTAPLNAKLNQNEPFDSISTGVEFEANAQAAITSDQYEEGGYLSVAVLDTQRLLGQKPLTDILKGHGEIRDRIIDEWNATHPPDERLGVRDDFNFPESELFRYYVQQFLDRHPEIIGQRPLAHLP